MFVGAGDIARCTLETDEATAQLLDVITGTVFTLGDSVYPDGTAAEFAACYEPTWGRHKARTRPSPGNHDYHVPGALDYFNYFGAAAGEVGQGYYSYDLGDWHIIALSTECGEVGGCSSNSPQGQWLQADLAANPRACTLAYGHHPRFSSGKHGNDPDMADFWQILYDAGADVILSGHDHDYERFAPQDPNGVLDLQFGLRQFVVGTGGTSLSDFGDGSFSYSPNPDFNGSDSFVYEICDTEPLCDTVTVTISVDPVNDPPLANDDSVSTVENTAVIIDVTANDTDVESNLDPTSANITCAGCAGPNNGTLTNNGDGRASRTRRTQASPAAIALCMRFVIASVYATLPW